MWFYNLFYHADDIFKKRIECLKNTAKILYALAVDPVEFLILMYVMCLKLIKRINYVHLD